MSNFNFLGKVDISNFKEKLLSFGDSIWNENNERQAKHQVHYNTFYIPLMWDVETSSEMIWGEKTKYYDYLNAEILISKIEEKINSSLGLDGVVFRSILAKLNPNDTIPSHIDYADMMKYSKKIHVPIVTNDKVFFQVGVEEKNLGEGEIWDIDVTKIHSVHNESSEDRVHLILMYTHRKDLLQDSLITNMDK